MTKGPRYVTVRLTRYEASLVLDLVAETYVEGDLADKKHRAAWKRFCKKVEEALNA